MKAAVLILAGGMSRRMQYPKPWLPFRKDQSYLEKIILEYYGFGCRKIVVVINEKFCQSPWEDLISKLSIYATFIKNIYPEKEKAYSIISGLKHLPDCPYLFIQNIDNPFIDNELLTALFNNRNQKDYTIPVYKNYGGHPLLISKKIINDLRRCKSGSFNLRVLLKRYNRKEVDFPKKEILANINTKDDYELFFKKRLPHIESVL